MSDLANEKKKYLGKEAFEKKASFYFFLGPIFLLVCTSLATLKFSSVQSLVAFGLICSLLVFWKHKHAGLLLGLSVLAGSSLWQLKTDSWWQAGLTLSIGLSWLITALSYREEASTFDQFSHKEQESLRKIQSLQKENEAAQNELKLITDYYKKNQEDLHAEKEKVQEKSFSLQHFMAKDQLAAQRIEELVKECLRVREKNTSLELAIEELNKEKERSLQDVVLAKQHTLSLQSQHVEDQEKITTLMQELEEQKNSIDGLKKQNTLTLQSVIKEEKEKGAALQKELNEKKGVQLSLDQAKKEYQQLSQLHEAFCKKAQEKDEELLSLDEKLEALAASNFKKEKDIEQLKRQFAEKATILNETRRELFYAEGKIIALQKEIEQKESEINPNELLFTGHLLQVEQERKELETEVEHLHEIVSKMLTKKTPAARKKKQVEATPKHDLELNF